MRVRGRARRPARKFKMRTSRTNAARPGDGHRETRAGTWQRQGREQLTPRRGLTYLDNIAIVLLSNPEDGWFWGSREGRGAEEKLELETQRFSRVSVRALVVPAGQAGSLCRLCFSLCWAPVVSRACVGRVGNEYVPRSGPLSDFSRLPFLTSPRVCSSRARVSRPLNPPRKTQARQAGTRPSVHCSPTKGSRE